MTLRIEKKFVVAAPADAVWAFLTDPRKVASCLPGASITGEIDEKTYAGAMNVKVGPVNAQYRGKLRFERLDADTREAEIVATGQETRGKGGADMRMTSRVVALGPDETEVHVTSDVQVAGVLAQLGGRMIQDVSDQMFEKFTAAMRRQLEPGGGAGTTSSPMITGTSTSGPPAPGVGPEPALAAAEPEPIPSARASAVAVPLSLAEPREADAMAPGTGGGPTRQVAAAASASLAGGAIPGAIAPPTRAGGGGGAAGDRLEQDPGEAADREGPSNDGVTGGSASVTEETQLEPGQEDVFDLGAFGSAAVGRAAGRLFRNPIIWIVLVALVALAWFVIT